MRIEKIFFLCDAPEFAQLRLQDPSTTTMEGLIAFNKHLLFVMTIIVVLVGWLLFATITTQTRRVVNPKGLERQIASSWLIVGLVGWLVGYWVQTIPPAIPSAWSWKSRPVNLQEGNECGGRRRGFAFFPRILRRTVDLKTLSELLSCPMDWSHLQVLPVTSSSKRVLLPTFNRSDCRIR